MSAWILHWILIHRFYFLPAVSSVPVCAGNLGLVSGYCWENGHSVSPTGDGLDGGACHNTALLHCQRTTAEN